MKYNLSAIVRRANSYAAAIGKSRAFKKSWAEEKMERLEGQLFMLNMVDFWSDADRAEYDRLSREISALRSQIASIENAQVFQFAAARPTAPQMSMDELISLQITYMDWPEALDRITDVFNGDAARDSIADLLRLAAA